MKKRCLHIFIAVLSSFSGAYAQVPLLNSYSPATATIYLDFNGGDVEGTLWNEHGTISAAPSGLSPASITWIHSLVAAHFILFNLNITTDSSVYLRAPAHQRARVIITPDGSWYGPATGVSAIGSFVWGDETPAWVFLNALSGNPQYIAAAATHQIGHTLGLQHQSLYDSYGTMVTELSGGENAIFSSGTALMGIPFYKTADWKDGHPSTGAEILQSDTARIAGAPNHIGYRPSVTEESLVENTVRLEQPYPGALELRSSGSYQFRLFDLSGRLLKTGNLKPGFNEIRTNASSTGIFVLQWSDERISGSRKIIL